MGQKRRRIALSCVDCRRRKVKCDRTYPSCIRCQKGGYGDKCLYVPHTGPGDGSSAGLLTPEDERRRRSTSKATWDADAEDYETTAHNNEISTNQRYEEPSSSSQPVPRSGNVPILAKSLPLAEHRIKELQNRVIELETWVFSAGGKPTSQEMNLGLYNPMGPGADRNRNPFSESYNLADSEKVLLRGKSFKTQYLGPSNCLAILLQFEDLSKFVREILLVLPSLQHAKHSLSRLRQREKQAATRQYDISIESLVSLVPEKSYADRLVYNYLETIETTYRIVHVPTFLADYEAYWRNPKDARLDFVVQLLICMAIVCCIVPGGEEGFVGRSSAKRELATHWVNICSFWLESQSQKHVSLINYQLHIQIWLAKRINCIKVKRYWSESGLLIRRFMAAGLHRDPNLLCGKINAFDREMRRRLWYTVLEIDLQSALDRGITPTIGPLEWDTEPPLNIDDDGFDFDSDTLPAPKPRGSFTRSSWLAWAAESLPLRIEILYKVNSIRDALTYNTIMEYDIKVRHHYDEVPRVEWQQVAIPAQSQSKVTTPAGAAPTPATSSTSKVSSSLKSAASSLIALTLSQSMLNEYLVILHQPFPAELSFKSSHLHSRLARRWACASTVLLYNPHLSITDTHKQLTIPSEFHLNETQKRFFAFLREDYLRAALSLAHSFAVATTGIGSHKSGPWMQHIGDDARLIPMIEATVTMLEDKVNNLGQGFHGYWITSSALSFVHSKQSPDVPRGHFARAAADRVVRLHSTVMDGQLPRAKRLMLPVDEATISATQAVSPNNLPTNGSRSRTKSAARQAEAVTSVDGAIETRETATPAEINAAMNNVYGDMMPSGTGRSMLAPTNVDIGGGGAMLFDGGAAGWGGVGTDEMNGQQQSSVSFDDLMFDISSLDWNQLMSADPMAFMMGSGDFSS